MTNQIAEDKNSRRDLIEYILLISFVLFGSSAVLAQEFQAARNPGNPTGKTSLRAVASVLHRNDIFGQSTKRHIK